MDPLESQAISDILASLKNRGPTISPDEIKSDLLDISFDSYLPGWPWPESCVPSYAGLSITARSNEMRSHAYDDLCFYPLRRSKLLKDEIKRLQRIIDGWDETKFVPWFPSPTYCAFDVRPDIAPSIRWRNSDREYLQSAGDLAQALKEIIATKPPWTT